MSNHHGVANDPPLPRILVVEDERPMRIVLHDCLERHGYRVLVAEDGASALDTALREQPDLIVLDVMMPRLDGLAVCAALADPDCVQGPISWAKLEECSMSRSGVISEKRVRPRHVDR